MMDISSNKKWLTYVCRMEYAPGKFAFSLCLRKFAALNDETVKEEEFGPPSHHSNLQMENTLEQTPLEICIDKYFEAFSGYSYFLSMSFDGQYIVLSSVAEGPKSVKKKCVVYRVQNNLIKPHYELECEGRAVFLDRGKELCLAVLGNKYLRVYNCILLFSKSMQYDEYDISSFRSENDNRFYALEPQNSYTASACRGTIPGSFHYCYLGDKQDVDVEDEQEIIRNWEYILATSAYIKDNIFLTFSTTAVENVRFWSLKLKGDRLASIVTPFNAVIAISSNLKYAATIAYNPLFQRATSDSRGNQCAINIFNLENGCLAYTLKSEICAESITHATFCKSSRYLALSVLKNGPEVEAIFEVYHIESQTLIYSVTKKMENYKECSSSLETIKIMKPFILEEMVGGKECLKGFYFKLDQTNNQAIMKCFLLKLDCDYDIKWLTKGDWPMEMKFCPLPHKFSEEEQKAYCGVTSVGK